MFPNFPKTKQNLHNALMEFFQNQVFVHSGGLIKDIPKRIIHEGNGFIMEYEDGMIDDTKLTLMRSSFEYNARELIKNPGDIFSKLNEMAKSHAMQELKLVVDKISEVSEKIGNVTKYKKEITPEDLFDAFEKITIDFNADGSARMPQIWGGEAIMRALPKVFEQIDKDPVLTKKFTDIMDRQKQKWHDREVNRKLVD